MIEFVSLDKVYSSDKDFEDYVRGKTIAIVGPASSIQGKGYGELIDSYDIVARINMHQTITDGYKEDYGSRTDVLVSNLNFMSQDEVLYNLKGLEEQIKLLVCSYTTNLSTIDEKISKNNKYKFLLVDKWEMYNTFRSISGICLPHTGTYFITYLLRYSNIIKEIFLTGLTFYNMGSYGETHFGQYIDHKLQDSVNIKRYHTDVLEIIRTGKMKGDAHSTMQEIEYFREVILPNYKDIIILDDYLKENLIKR